MQGTRIDWADWTDRIISLLPEADPAKIRDLGHDDDELFDHIADRHDLTRQEAREVLLDRILVRQPDTGRMAAE